MYGVGIHLSPVDSQSSAHTVHVTGKNGKHFIFAEEKLECSGLVSNQQQIPKVCFVSAVPRRKDFVSPGVNARRAVLDDVTAVDA
ncbi:hypothetical protein OUZ56_020627 [Daphnia magna]|uniref:Uncharacterized protein n=1 Tax=Daphnia magna TaxID=35525 RepID=A0ABQ9ZEZ3_9CRUS|nr:hypothetical protein OUZ56_020627 [Daphnia magna]